MNGDEGRLNGGICSARSPNCVPQISPLDACNQSPARVPGALTVAATDRRDARWPYSNRGPCVDVYAPGVGLQSATFYTRSASVVASGTSMACPLASGAAAAYLSDRPLAPPAEVHAYLVANASVGVVIGMLEDEGTPNRLLQVPAAIAPGVSISPAVLQPVILYSGTVQAATQRQVVVSNGGDDGVTFQARPVFRGITSGWLTVIPSNGTIPPGGNVELTLVYSFDEEGFQGAYDADVHVTTTGFPASLVRGCEGLLWRGRQICVSPQL